MAHIFVVFDQQFMAKNCAFEVEDTKLIHFPKHNHNMSYYKTIDGKKMDGHLLEMAEGVVKGQGDGRISKEDAEKLLVLVTDGGQYTDRRAHV